ncbi:hypothetical protein FHW69_003670 [Luteibacter sp. Sphag1AF]|uniref:hypothetical protein n=1 Tax=Luteibacter sp. Sphag1AF TaxID=2587031 RepID=UPI001618A8B8|nr:hypothetical protein [Luteibacter sp. Sphag1AF]MBB3229022.1 hypothetical protein [Luteibacter sp. Sphag1AF]
MSRKPPTQLLSILSLPQQAALARVHVPAAVATTPATPWLPLSLPLPSTQPATAFVAPVHNISARSTLKGWHLWLASLLGMDLLALIFVIRQTRMDRADACRAAAALTAHAPAVPAERAEPLLWISQPMRTCGPGVPAHAMDLTEDGFAHAAFLRWLLIGASVGDQSGAGLNEPDAVAPVVHAGDVVATRAPREPVLPAAAALRQQFAQIMRLSQPSRLLAFRALQESPPDNTHPQWLDVWIDILTAWAGDLPAHAALARYLHAAQLCTQLAAVPHWRDDAQWRHAMLARRCAELTEPPDRARHLHLAGELLDALYQRKPDASLACAIAEVACERAALLPPEELGDVCSHALVHAFMAEADDSQKAGALRCRLTAQRLHDAVSESGAGSELALRLVTQLKDAAPDDPVALIQMAAVYLDDDDLAAASQCCEQAWRVCGATPEILSVWQAIFARWNTLAQQGAMSAPSADSVRRYRVAHATRTAVPPRKGSTCHEHDPPGHRRPLTPLDDALRHRVSHAAG